MNIMCEDFVCYHMFVFVAFLCSKIMRKNDVSEMVCLLLLGSLLKLRILIQD